MTRTPKFSVTNKDRRATIEIYDEIGPWWMGMIDSKLVSAEINKAGTIDSIEVRINSPGGDAFEGLAIYNILRQHSAKVSVRVDGVAASAASIIAMAGDEITIPKNALLMIHDPATMAWGGVGDLQKAIAMLESTKSALVETYATRTTKSKDEIAALMTEETWFTGEEAVAAGFAHRTTDEIKPASGSPEPKADNRFRRPPSNFAALLFATPFNHAEEPDPMSVKTQEQIDAENKAAADAKVKAEADAKAKAEADAKAAADKHAADVKAATEAERKRTSEISAACKLAGRPEDAAKFIDEGTDVQTVKNQLFELVCKDRKPSDDGQSTVQTGPDANAKYKDEYKQNAAAYAAAGMKEDDYVQMRRRDDGLETLQAGKK